MTHFFADDYLAHLWWTHVQQLQRRRFLGERTFRNNVTIRSWCVLDS